MQDEIEAEKRKMEIFQQAIENKEDGGTGLFLPAPRSRQNEPPHQITVIPIPQPVSITQQTPVFDLDNFESDDDMDLPSQKGTIPKIRDS